MVDGSRSFFSNKWRHYNIIALAKVINVLANFCIPISSCCSFCLTPYYLSIYYYSTSMEFGFFK